MAPTLPQILEEEKTHHLLRQGLLAALGGGSVGGALTARPPAVRLRRGVEFELLELRVLGGDAVDVVLEVGGVGEGDVVDVGVEFPCRLAAAGQAQVFEGLPDKRGVHVALHAVLHVGRQVRAQGGDQGAVALVVDSELFDVFVPDVELDLAFVVQ